jgi:hypothetical protein
MFRRPRGAPWPGRKAGFAAVAISSFQSVVGWGSALPSVRGHISYGARAEEWRRPFYPNCGQKQNWRRGKEERTVMCDGLTEGTVHRAIVNGRLAMRGPGQVLGDRRRRARMNMRLGYVGLQRKRDQEQTGNETPPPPPAYCRACRHPAAVTPSCRESRPNRVGPARQARAEPRFSRMLPGS